MSAAAYQRTTHEGQPGLSLNGDWTLAHLPRPLAAFERELCRQAICSRRRDMEKLLEGGNESMIWMNC